MNDSIQMWAWMYINVNPSKRCVFITVAKSSGVWPSWFFMVGSAPWASSRAQSCVRPFCAASWRGVKAHLSVAFTQVLNLISRAAMSTCWKGRQRLITDKIIVQPTIFKAWMLIKKKHSSFCSRSAWCKRFRLQMLIVTITKWYL